MAPLPDIIVEIGQRLEWLKSNTFENYVSASAQTSRVEEDNSSSSSASVDSFDNSNSDREEEMAGNNDDNRALEDYAQLGLSEANMRMRVFPYTLKDRAKGWLMTLAPGSLTTWDAIAKKFLAKFFSTQKTATLRGQIFNFKQYDGEPFNECWECFKGLLLQCPHHGLPLYLQMQIFYDGLTQTCQSTIDNAAGGALKKKKAQESYNIYEMLGSNPGWSDHPNLS
ncbi:unnamed protein product [Prunus armeniaca]